MGLSEIRTVIESRLPQTSMLAPRLAMAKERVVRGRFLGMTRTWRIGGNCDIENLSRGNKVYLPIHVSGVKSNPASAICISRRGDGEISFCGAIEMAGVIIR